MVSGTAVAMPTAQAALEAGKLDAGGVEQLLSWALPQLADAAGGDVNRVTVALAALCDLALSGSMAAAAQMGRVLEACQGLLEDEATPPTLLQPLLRLLAAMAVRHSDRMQSRFEDVVDLLLGWALEPNLSASDRVLISHCFLHFHSLWANNFSMAQRLLNKLLGDMEALANDAVLKLRRLEALAACFRAVLQATWQGLQAPEEPRERMASLVQQAGPMLHRWLTCAYTVAASFLYIAPNSAYSPVWLPHVCQLLHTFADVLSHKLSSSYKAILTCLDRYIMLAKSSTTELILLLKTNLHLLIVQGVSVLPTALQSLMASSGQLADLRLHSNRAVVTVVAATYGHLLRHRQARRILAEETKSLLQELACYRSKDSKELPARGCEEDRVWDGDTWCDAQISEVHPLAIIRFNIRALSLPPTEGIHEMQELNGEGYKGERFKQDGTESNNTFLMFTEALAPHLDLFVNLSSAYPGLEVLLLQAMRQMRIYRTGKGKIAATTEKLMEDTHGEMEPVEPVEPVELYAGGIDAINGSSRVLSKMLHCSAPLPVKLGVLDWISQGANEAGSDTYKHKSSLAPQLFKVFTRASWDKETVVRETVATLGLSLLQFDCLEAGQIYELASAALYRLADVEGTVQKAYSQLLASCVPAALWMEGSLHPGPLESSLEKLGVPGWSQKGEGVNPQLLVAVLNFIAQRRVPFPPNWLQRLLHASSTSLVPHVLKESPSTLIGPENDFEEDNEGSLVDAATANSATHAAWWAVQEAAQQCVAARLRTHLGGPSATFSSLERMLQEIAQQCMSEQGERDCVGAANPSAALLPMRLLPEFVDGLERHIYNANEGCMGLQAASQASTTFFVANRKVCEEWFGRMREALLHAGLAVQSPAVTLRAAALRLQDLRSVAAAATRGPVHSEGGTPMLMRVRQDVQHVLRHVALALYRCRDSDGLVGLQTWVATSLGGLLYDNGMSYEEASSPLGSLGWIAALVLQSKGQYEWAASHFAGLLRSTLDTLPPETVQFCIARSIESYAALADWDSLHSWLQELQALRVQHAGNPAAAALNTSGAGEDLNAIHALACFDAGDTASAWPYLGLTPQSSKELTSDPRQALLRSEQMLLQAMLRFQEGSSAEPSELSTALAMLDAQLQSATLGGLWEAEAALLQRECISLMEASQPSSSQQGSLASSSLLKACEVPLDRDSQNTAPWLKLLRTARLVAPTGPLTAALELPLARLARKQGNLRLAERLLTQCQCSGLLQVEEQIFEITLLRYSQGRFMDAMLQLWGLCSETVMRGFGVSQFRPGGGDSQGKAIAALKFSKWLQASPLPVSHSTFLQGIAAPGNVPGLSKASFFGGGNSGEAIGEAEALVGIERLTGASLRGATVTCPGMAKAWYLQATWSFATAFGVPQGSSTLPGLPLSGSYLQTATRNINCQLTTEEKIIITSILAGSMEVNVNLLQHCLDLLQNALQKSMDEGRLGTTEVSQLEERLKLALQMMGGFSLQQAESSVRTMLQLWQGNRQRRMGLLAESLQAYLRFLAVAHHQGGESSIRWSGRVKPSPHEISLSSMLHVLHLVLVHGAELQAVFEAGFASLPPNPWQALLPQIFARLSAHPEEIVRQQLERLLQALAVASPTALVYPAVVEANLPGGGNKVELQRVLAQLIEREPGLVEDVRSLLAQLGSMAVLWEEQWLALLQELQPDALRRLSALCDYATRLAGNPELGPHERGRLLSVKYNDTMLPLLTVLEKRLASTGKPAQNAHQRWFQTHFQSHLVAAVASLKQPPRSNSATASAWRPLELLGMRLSRELKRNLPLCDISEQLVQLSGSCAPMPGLAENSLMGNEKVTVVGVEDSLAVLSTKTRPKRLVFVGSDGQRYQYLLKGHEDLRLDARIMQLLRAVNGTLQRNRATRTRGLSARHYAVIPIGPRVGLIQWLDGLHSLYSIYRAWQRRQHVGTAPLPRPTDVFYTKMMAALKEKGLRRMLARKDWPHEVKKRVLLELMKETPRHLLARELWAATHGGTQEWWTKQQRFGGSMAVMSMVGYVLGVGDRHLDNMLLDLRSGELVHIDFGVCFEKGLRLRIPEIVPFRLTQTLQSALGFTGVEGRMRASCEATMEALRRNRSTLLMLLAVFVWDPLLDWLHPHTDTEEGDEMGIRDRTVESVTTLDSDASPHGDMPAGEDRGQGPVLATGDISAITAVEMLTPESLVSPPGLSLSSEASAGWLSVPSSQCGSSALNKTLDKTIVSSEASCGVTSGPVPQGERAVSSLASVGGDLNLPATLEEQGDAVFSQDFTASVPATPPQAEQGEAVEGDQAVPSPLFTVLGDRALAAGDNEVEPPQGIAGGASDLASLGRRADAVAAVQRVYNKLEGRDLDAKRQLEVVEQVAHLLQQARSLDNLCSMYEGWTPWI